MNVMRTRIYPRKKNRTTQKQTQEQQPKNISVVATTGHHYLNKQHIPDRISFGCACMYNIQSPNCQTTAFAQQSFEEEH
jgi:hypothetical protein